MQLEVKLIIFYSKYKTCVEKKKLILQKLTTFVENFLLGYKKCISGKFTRNYV